MININYLSKKASIKIIENRNQLIIQSRFRVLINQILGLYLFFWKLIFNNCFQ